MMMVDDDLLDMLVKLAEFERDNAELVAWRAARAAEYKRDKRWDRQSANDDENDWG